MWNDDLQVTVHSYSFYIIHATVVNSTSILKFGLVCIYGDPYHRQISQTWDEVASFVYDNSSIPMLCMGDMNELLYDMDKNSPNINCSHMYAFRSFVKSCGLFDLGFSGPAYTWTNKRFSSKPTFERLDRCLVNVEWCNAFPISNFYNMPLIHSLSDHAAILLSTDGPIRKIKQKPLNLKTGGWKKLTSKNMQKLFGLLQKTNLSRIELTILQVILKFGVRRRNLCNRN
jgi:endonuclease/exonuclease/phosphatase family metal-dependent hydrolase